MQQRATRGYPQTLTETFARPLELRRVDGRDLGQPVDARGHDIGLALTCLGEVQARRLPRENLAGRRRQAVTDQEN